MCMCPFRCFPQTEVSMGTLAVTDPYAARCDNECVLTAVDQSQHYIFHSSVAVIGSAQTGHPLHLCTPASLGCPWTRHRFTACSSSDHFMLVLTTAYPLRPHRTLLEMLWPRHLAITVLPLPKKIQILTPANFSCFQHINFKHTVAPLVSDNPTFSISHSSMHISFVL